MKAPRELLYTGTSGTNCRVNGNGGVVTGWLRETGRITGAFVKLDDGGMLHVIVTPYARDPHWQQVVSWRDIDREEFDTLMGLRSIREELGWRT